MFQQLLYPGASSRDGRLPYDVLLGWNFADWFGILFSVMALLLMLSAMREAAIGSLIAKGAEPYPHDDRGWDWRVMRNVVGQDPGGKTLGKCSHSFADRSQRESALPLRFAAQA